MPLWPFTADVPQRHKPSLRSLAPVPAATAMGKFKPTHKLTPTLASVS